MLLWHYGLRFEKNVQINCELVTKGAITSKTIFINVKIHKYLFCKIKLSAYLLFSIYILAFFPNYTPPLKNTSLYNELFWIEKSEKLQKKNRRKETKKKCYNALIWVWSFVYVTHCFLFLQKRVHVICFKSSSHKVTSVIYCFPKFLRVRPDQRPSKNELGRHHVEWYPSFSQIMSIPK